MISEEDASNNQANGGTEYPVYENHESMRLMQDYLNSGATNQLISQNNTGLPNLNPFEDDLLPQGWERFVDPIHGTYYIDHNTQRTQFERPYEVELTKGSMGFGFTLVESDGGLLLVRSIIPGGPAHMNGSIRPGDILVSAIGVSVTGLQHTDIARLFSTFAVGDRVPLTFARSNFILDETLVPDEYLFSNGTNGDLAIAVNPDNYQRANIQPSQDPHIEINHEYESVKAVLKCEDQVMSHGTLHDEHDEYEYHNVELERESTESNWGIRLIGGAEVGRAISIGSMIFGGIASKSGKLKSGDEIISIDGVSVIGAAHQAVVELISACRNRVSLQVRRKTFAEACDVVLTKNMDEGFGFVIISIENYALIGKIIEGSPADRCKQLRVRDRIIVINGRYITPDMKHPEIVNMIKECGSTLRLQIIPVDCYTVKLIKDVYNDSFGFRMRGGSEYDDTPLYIVRVEPNGQAHGLLNVGDQILEINNTPTVGMTHAQAATIIKYSDPIVKLKLRRNHITPPSLLVDSPRSLQHYNQTAEMKQVNQISTPNEPAIPQDITFASLPPDLSFVDPNVQQNSMQAPMATSLSDHTLQATHHQLMHDQNPMMFMY